MKKISLKIYKILTAGIISIAILSAICLVYSYNMLGIPTVTGASGYSCEPGSLKSKMDEGFGWNVMDANGYNNDEAYNDVDVLLMGGSHIEALQMNRSESVTHKLDEMLTQYHVYDVGTSGHSTEICSYYLDNACSYFLPQYVVIDLSSLELDEKIMSSVISGTYRTPELLSQKSNVIRVIRDYIPASGKMMLQLKNWENLGAAEDVNKDEADLLHNDNTYMETLKNFLDYMNDIVQKYGSQLILLYHPMNYNVNDTGQLIFEEETDAWNNFQKLCEKTRLL